MELDILRGFGRISGTASRIAARYTDHGTYEEHCGICIHFQSQGVCDKIAGPVAEDGWCKFFDKRTLQALANMFQNPDPRDSY